MPQFFKRGEDNMFKRKQLNIVALILCAVLILTFVALANDEPFKVKLGLFERIVTMSLLPQKGNFATLKIVTELNMMLAPTDEEYIAAGLQPTEQGGVLAENWQAVEEKEFTFKEAALKMIRAALKKLDEEEKLTMEHFRVYQKFMIVEEKEEEE